MGGNETRLCAPGREGKLEEVAGLGHPTSQRVAEGSRVHTAQLGLEHRLRPSGSAKGTGDGIGAPRSSSLSPWDQASSGATAGTPGSGASFCGPTLSIQRRLQWVGPSLGSSGCTPAVQERGHGRLPAAHVGLKAPAA